MTNDKFKKQRKYDLEERTALFGEKVIEFIKTIPRTPFNESIIKQLIRSATSIGANYMEANGASSKRDFSNKIYYCKKEANETRHWLRMFSACNPENKETCFVLWDEAHALTLIFSKIAASSKIQH